MIDWNAVWKRITHDLSEAFFPTRCVICNEFYTPPRECPRVEDIRKIQFAEIMAPCLCSECIGTSDFSFVESPVYGNKLNPPRQFRTARAVAAYNQEDEVFAKMIRKFKYDDEIQLAHPFEMLIFSSFVRHWEQSEIDLVMPVPLHARRLRKRRFNQSYLLIRKWPGLGKAFDIDLSHLRIEWDALVRIRDTFPQVDLKGKERKENIREAFSIKRPSAVRGKKVLLVDDIYTTGATANECAKELLKSGAEYTDVLTLGRTV